MTTLTHPKEKNVFITDEGPN